MTDSVTLIQPDDWHLHVRDGAYLQSVLKFSAKQMHRAIIMPNLSPPVVQVADALAYKQRIFNCLPPESDFEPLMTLYLTDKTTIQMVKDAKANGIVAFKLYPRGATTNSDSGVTDLFKLLPVLSEIQKQNLLLLIHGEVTDPDIDIFDRESVFIDTILNPLRQQLPELKIVLEHITTKQAAQLVAEADEYLSATVTPQHLLFNRNAILVGGIQPHHYCLPIIKREEHRVYLVKTVTGKNYQKFFLGTDSAPHSQDKKEAACGCAGVFSAPIALELYTEVFEQAGALDKLEFFTSLNGPKFYGLPINQKKVTLIKRPQLISEYYTYGDERIIPLFAGKQIAWQLKDNNCG